MLQAACDRGLLHCAACARRRFQRSAAANIRQAQKAQDRHEHVCDHKHNTQLFRLHP